MRCKWLVINLFLIILGKSAMGEMHQNFAQERSEMVKTQLANRDIQDRRVLEAMNTVPRHLFVPPELMNHAYEDNPLPIGYDQTISQPYMVAYIAQHAQLSPNDKVLEIGTGCGYQAAVMSHLAKDVYTIEIVEPLGEEAIKRLHDLKYTNVHAKIGDGYHGWAEHAPYDAIVLTASSEDVPPPLLKQLKMGGRILIPFIEGYEQNMITFKKTPKGLVRESSLPVRFVPFTRKIMKNSQPTEKN